jgi:hypothetical protein
MRMELRSMITVIAGCGLVCGLQAQAIEMHGKDFNNQGGYYQDRQGQWLAINPNSGLRTTYATTPFTGSQGMYDITLHGVGEEDGQAEYKVWVGGDLVGEFQCPSTAEAFEEGPDFNGTWDSVMVSNGEEIKVQSWVDSAVIGGSWEYCRARWSKIVFSPVEITADPTAIVSPEDGAVLTMGETITLEGSGTDLFWQYDANSDQLGVQDIDSGATVEFTVPTNVDDPWEITLILSGAGGTVETTYNLEDQTGVRRDMVTAQRRQVRGSYARLFSVGGACLGQVRIEATGAQMLPDHIAQGVYYLVTADGVRQRVVHQPIR